MNELFAGGVAGYLLGTIGREEKTVTKTETTTMFETRERTTTSVSTKTTILTQKETSTVTSTKTVEVPVFQKLAKSYSPRYSKYEINVVVGVEREGGIKNAKAYLEYPSGMYEIYDLPYEGKKVELNGKDKELFVFEGRFLSSELDTHFVSVEVESKDGIKIMDRNHIDLGISSEQESIFVFATSLPPTSDSLNLA